MTAKEGGNAARGRMLKLPMPKRLLIQTLNYQYFEVIFIICLSVLGLIYHKKETIWGLLISDWLEMC